MTKPKKTKNGKWTIRVYDYQDETGKQHYKRITEDTRDACIVAASLFRAEKGTKKEDPPALTVGEAVDQYIDLCRVLSPTTVAGYEKIRRTGFMHLWDIPAATLSNASVQAAVNIEAMREGRRGPISTKTLGNEWGLISSALWKVCGLKFSVRLPQRQRKWKDYPETKQVLDAIKGTSVELPCMMALHMGFRMSEIRGFKWEDIHGDYITINRVVVDVGTLPVEKEETKTLSSKRAHKIPKQIRTLMDAADHSQPYIVPLNHSQIYGRFSRIMEKAGLDLTFHDLRHMNTSIMVMLGIPETCRMERNGWSSPQIMKSHYEHAFDSMRVEADRKIDAYFDGLARQHDLKHDFDIPNLLKTLGLSGVRLP